MNINKMKINQRVLYNIPRGINNEQSNSVDDCYSINNWSSGFEQNNKLTGNR